ncbi:hypothetical protein FKM82_007286 [Ascaphus truei]
MAPKVDKTKNTKKNQGELVEFFKKQVFSRHSLSPHPQSRAQSESESDAELNTLPSTKKDIIDGYGNLKLLPQNVVTDLEKEIIIVLVPTTRPLCLA